MTCYWIHNVTSYETYVLYKRETLQRDIWSQTLGFSLFFDAVPQGHESPQRTSPLSRNPRILLSSRNKSHYVSFLAISIPLTSSQPTSLRLIFILFSDSLRTGRSGDRIPVGARFSAPVQAGSEANPASYTVGTGSFPGKKRPWRCVDHPPHLAPRLKKG